LIQLCNFQKTAKINNYPVGENWPDLVTIIAKHFYVKGDSTPTAPLPWVFICATRLGKISPFGHIFLSLGAFFSEKYLPNDFGHNVYKKIAQTSPKKFQISATFCLYLNSQILSYLARLQFGRYLDDIG
jgi:hypothetical protein